MNAFVAGLLVVIAVLVAVAIAASVWQPARLTVYEYERGLRYRRGRLLDVLGPGVYWISRRSSQITRIDVRRSQMVVAGQELLSSDGIGLKVSLAATIEVIDPALAVNTTQSYLQALYTALQMAVRELVGATTIEDLIAGRGQIGERLLERCGPQAEALGVRLHQADIRDIMLPGDLKRIFAQEVQARKEGQAALEKARGETAALRNLANAARLVRDNPALLQLRIVQQVAGSTGNTVVLGVPPGNIPIPVADGEGKEQGSK